MKYSTLPHVRSIDAAKIKKKHRKEKLAKKVQNQTVTVKFFLGYISLIEAQSNYTAILSFTIQTERRKKCRSKKFCKIAKQKLTSEITTHL